MIPDDDYPHPLGLHVTENREREAKASFAGLAGSDVKAPNQRYSALKFAQKWLWESKARQTLGREWPSEYLNDTVSMMMAYHDKQQDEKGQL